MVVGAVAKGEGTGHDREGLHFGFDEVDAAGGFDEVGEVGGDANADDGDAVVGLRGQKFTDEFHRVFGVLVAFEVVRIMRRFGELEVLAFALLRLRIAGDADGQIRTAMEGVLRVHEACGERVVFGNGDAEKLTGPAIRERVAHGEREHVVHITGDVGVEEDARLFGAERRAKGEEEKREEAHGGGHFGA